MITAEAPLLRNLSRIASRKTLFFACLLLVLAGGLYASTLIDLVSEWWRNPDYSHGFLVPLAMAYFLKRKWKVLSDLTVQPADSGLVILLLSQAIFLVGYLGSEFFLQRISILVFLTGSILFFLGWRHAREMSYILCLFALAIPLPALIFNALTLPMQLLASSWAESTLRFCHVPVYREGNILQLAHEVLNVTEACSGVRSLISLITLGMIIAPFLLVRWWIRAAFVLSALPIAIVANVFRVAATGLLSGWIGSRAATGFFHTFSGLVIFLAGCLMLLAEASILLRTISREKA